MLDLTNYNVDVNIPITQAEYEERKRKGLIKSGEQIRVIDNNGNVTIYITIPPPTCEPKHTIKHRENHNFFKLTDWYESNGDGKNKHKMKSEKATITEK